MHNFTLKICQKDRLLDRIVFQNSSLNVISFHIQFFPFSFNRSGKNERGRNKLDKNILRPSSIRQIAQAARFGIKSDNFVCVRERQMYFSLTQTFLSKELSQMIYFGKEVLRFRAFFFPLMYIIIFCSLLNYLLKILPFIEMLIYPKIKLPKQVKNISQILYNPTKNAKDF